MRLILLLLACGTALLACDATDSSTMAAPEPAVLEPEGPEPEGQPDMPDPDPEPEPDYGPAPPPGDGVFRGLGTLLVQVSGGNAFEMGGTLVVTPITADGERLPSLSAPMGLYPVEFDWQVQRWWPVDPALLDARVVEAEVEVHDVDRVLRSETMVIADLPVVETGCDPAGFANRCAQGSTCFFVDADSAGRCDPIEAQIWRHDRRLHFDFRADRGRRAGIASPAILRADAIERIVLNATEDADWRAIGSLWTEQDPAEFPLFIGPHQRHARAAVQVPPVRADGEACDVLRIADICAETTACSLDGACQGITAPVLTQVEFIGRDDIAGLYFTGVDPDGDVDHLIIHDDNGEAKYPLLAYGAHTPRAQGAIEVGENGEFEGLWMVRDSAVPTGLITVQAVDSEGLRSPLARISILGAPNPGTVEGICDDAGLIITCPDGTGCDLRDGERQFSCQPLEVECLAPDRFEAFIGDVMDGSNNGPDATTNSCHRSRGNLGQEAGFTFTADMGGLHRFTAESGTYGALGSLAVRSICHLSGVRTSERACAPDMSGGNGADALHVEVELDAGETIYVVVESHWVGGGPFRLTVGRP